MVNAKPRRRRRGLAILVSALVVLVLVWCGYWYATNRFVASAIGKAVASFAARGQALGCAEESTGGFPLSLDFDCSRATFADSAAGMSGELGRITASAPLYWPGSVTTALASPFVLAAPSFDLGVEAAWTNGVATVDAGMGGLNGGSASLDNLTLSRTNKAKALPFAALAASHAEVSAAPEGGGAYRFAVSADGVVININNQKALPEFEGEIAVTALDFGGSLGTDPKRAIAAWLAGGGKLRLDSFVFTVRDSSARATGTLEISKDGLLSGDLVLQLAGLAGVPDIVENIRPKARERVSQVVAAIGALTKPVAGQAGAREVPVVIRNGMISVGFIPVGTIPPLKF